jgi:chromosome segregation ATPase
VKRENELLTIIEKQKLELKSAKKILESEIGENVVSISQAAQNWKGRQQQIIALQSRIKELERIKSENVQLPKQIKQLRKDNQDLLQKFNNTLKEKNEAVEESNKKIRNYIRKCSQ